MGAIFNFILVFLFVPLIYIKFGSESNNPCIFEMEEFDEVINEIVSAKNSSNHEKADNLYSACAKTVECFEMLDINDYKMDPKLRSWKEMFVIQIKPVCNYLLYQSGDFFKCILKFQVNEFKLNSSTFYAKHSLENCQLDDTGFQELSDFSRRESGDSAVRNMMEHGEYVRATVCKSTRN
ncbi:unnamed protein product [Caenorhabditis nigoni]